MKQFLLIFLLPLLVSCQGNKTASSSLSSSSSTPFASEAKEFILTDFASFSDYMKTEGKKKAEENLSAANKETVKEEMSYLGSTLIHRQKKVRKDSYSYYQDDVILSDVNEKSYSGTLDPNQYLLSDKSYQVKRFVSGKEKVELAKEGSSPLFVNRLADSASFSSSLVDEVLEYVSSWDSSEVMTSFESYGKKSVFSFSDEKHGTYLSSDDETRYSLTFSEGEVSFFDGIPYAFYVSTRFFKGSEFVDGSYDDSGCYLVKSDAVAYSGKISAKAGYGVKDDGFDVTGLMATDFKATFYTRDDKTYQKKFLDKGAISYHSYIHAMATGVSPETAIDNDFDIVTSLDETKLKKVYNPDTDQEEFYSVGTGKVTVVVSNHNGVKKEYVLTIKAKPASDFDCIMAADRAYVSSRMLLTVKTYPLDCADTFAIDTEDPSAISVEKNGESGQQFYLTFHKEGKVRFTVRDEMVEGLSKSYTIEVLPKEENL